MHEKTRDMIFRGPRLLECWISIDSLQRDSITIGNKSTRRRATQGWRWQIASSDAAHIPIGVMSPEMSRAGVTSKA